MPIARPGPRWGCSVQPVVDLLGDLGPHPALANIKKPLHKGLVVSEYLAEHLERIHVAPLMTTNRRESVAAPLIVTWRLQIGYGLPSVGNRRVVVAYYTDR